MSQDQQTYKRASFAAGVGLIIQVVLSIIMGVTALSAESELMYLVTAQIACGIPIWVILWMIFNQHRLETAEALEAEQMSQADAQTAAIFDEHGVDLQIARRRLDNLYKWGLNIVGLFVALALLGGGSFLLYKALQANILGHLANMNQAAAIAIPGQELRNPGSAAIYMSVCGILAFVAFIVARYQAGMAKNAEWGLLRGGASFLMGNFIVLLLVAAAMAWTLSGDARLLVIMTLVVPVILVIIGLEILVGFLLNAYRPRRPGEVPPAPFDSRVLGLLTSPKSLLQAFNEAINYQFGFEITSSWLYQLMIRALTPLAVLGALILFLMSSLVVVEPQQQALITTFGKIDRVVDAGPHLKWFWPIGEARKYDVGRLHSISVGTAAGDLRTDGALLWTNNHNEGGEKEDYLVAAPGSYDQQSASQRLGNESKTQDDPPGASLIGIQIMVQYRVSDLKMFFSSAASPKELLEQISNQELAYYAFTHDIDWMLGKGRTTAGDELLARIKKQVNDTKLGFDVVLVTVSAVHPPSEENVSETFQEVIGADQEKQTAIERALKDAITTLADVAGSSTQAREIAEAIRKYDVYQRELGDKAQTPEQKLKLAAELRRVEDLLAKARGKASEIILGARSYRWERYLGERAQAERFAAQYNAFVGAPDLFRQRQYLDALSAGMANRRKIILLSDQDEPSVFRFDFKQQPNSIGNLMNSN